MRPRGSFGPVGQALLQAAARSPGTVTQLAERACVGYGVAARTASRFVAAGHLVRVSDERPALLAVPDSAPAACHPDDDGGAVFLLLTRIWPARSPEPEPEAAS